MDFNSPSKAEASFNMPIGLPNDNDDQMGTEGIGAGSADLKKPDVREVLSLISSRYVLDTSKI